MRFKVTVGKEEVEVVNPVSTMLFVTYKGTQYMLKAAAGRGNKIKWSATGLDDKIAQKIGGKIERHHEKAKGLTRT